MKRNSLLGGLSLVVAGAAIGSGALVSSNAMASDDVQEPTSGSAQVISISTDGTEPIACSFDDLDLPTLGNAELPAGAQGGGIVAVSASSSGTVITGADGQTPPDGAITVVNGEAVPVEGTITDLNGEPIDLTALTPGEGFPDLPALQVVSADDARQGTADECAAIRANLP